MLALLSLVALHDVFMTPWGCCQWHHLKVLVFSRDDASGIWLCISNSIFLRVVVTNSPQLIEVRDLNGCRTKPNYERCHTWSQLNAPQSLLLNITFNTTWWNYIYSGQDRWLWDGNWVCRVVFGEKTNHQNLFSQIQINIDKNSVDIISISFHMLLLTSWASQRYQWLRNWLSKSIRLVGVNMNMSARNRHSQTNYWCITTCGATNGGKGGIKTTLRFQYMGLLPDT